MCRKLIYLISFVVPVLSLISNAQAGEPTADAYIRGSANADINYGTATGLLIKNNNGGDNDRKVYMRFDVAGTIMEASLDLTVSTNNEGGGGTTPQTFTVEVYGLAESLDHTWIETEITWNNAPGNNTANHDFTEEATMLGSFIVDQTPAGDTVSFSDPALVDFINADTDNQITLLLRRTTGNGSHNLGFASREHTSYSVPTLNTIAATQAFGPNPADGAFLDATWASLSWRAIDSAVSHDVYIGDNFDDVKNGTGDTFVGNQVETTLVVGFPGFPYPDGLVPGTTYYWRIDEVNDAEPNSPWRGSVWSFSIAPNTAYNPDPADGAEFVATDTKLGWTAGYGAKLHTVYLGDDYDTVSNAAGGLPQGTTTYNPGPLQGEKVYYWRVDEFDAIATYKGDVWGFTTPDAAGSLQPANGAVDVQISSTLNWIPAANAVSHDVYFGTDRDAVKNATTASPEFKGNKASGAESYDPGKLAWNSDYYWRVDAVYSTGPVKGLVWNFITAGFMIVEDFESYNDIDPPDPNSNRIFDNWIDGFGTTNNGALVGNDLPPYAEQTIVHGGSQSMIYRYDNTNKTSEATLTLVYPRDWTDEGVTKLSLWFRGASGNSADRMFVALNGTAVVYHDDPAATQKGGWTQWVVDLTAFAGVNLANVNTITIGIGTKGPGAPGAAGGTGTMYFDDIRLIR
ncbi:MAG: DNRLRE domain-containing protein [Planctomycetota bacterium]